MIIIGIFSTITVGFVGRRRVFYIIVIGLIAYAIMVGGSASVVRATIMGILLLWADHLGRPYAAPHDVPIDGLLLTFPTIDRILQLAKNTIFPSLCSSVVIQLLFNAMLQ